MSECPDLLARQVLSWKSPVVARPAGKIIVGGRGAYDVELLVVWMCARTKGVADAA